MAEFVTKTKFEITIHITLTKPLRELKPQTVINSQVRCNHYYKIANTAEKLIAFFLLFD